MIVVSNTSPITNLAAVGQMDLLRLLFGRIVTPQAVVDELTARGVWWPGATELTQAKWIRVRQAAYRPLVNTRREPIAWRPEASYNRADTV